MKAVRVKGWRLLPMSRARHREPVYTIYQAFSSRPLCETIGIDGLMRSFPQLEPDLYQIREAGTVVASGERHADGAWKVEFSSGLMLSPGCIIV